MKSLTLEEFAEALRLKGDWREMEFADEILQLVALEEEVAEPYSNLCGDLHNAAPKEIEDNPEKALEWVIDRSNVLQDIEKALEEAERPGDPEDAVAVLLDEFETVETIMRKHGGWTEGDLHDAIFALIERADKAPPAMEYDL